MPSMFDPRYSRVALLACVLLLALTAGCAQRSDLKKTLIGQSRFEASERAPIVLAAYQPWFGRNNHMNVGYSSQDRVVLQRQIQEAEALGIAGFVVNWYGPRHPYEDQSYAMLQNLANADGNFKVSIMYDEDDSGPQDSTEAVLVDLQYAYDRYIGPHAQVPNTSYLRYNGRPVVFIFPKGTNTDWARVRQAVQSWEDPPLLIYKDVHEKWKDAFDGFYAWVQPGKEGWKPDGSNWGREYLEDFYIKMKTQHPDKLAVGAAWPGFNDTQASWSRNRKMDARCGKTFEDSLRLFRRYYDDNHQLPFLMIETWNDYEEGTAIEKGYAACGNKPQPVTTSAGQ
ncbi:MAG TPA: endo-1,3-alpha-glucanase family glycosylhydrolase [Clostridia bacterium]|nr:endo-1,3-alpha-glucanase family glycosylhydrolase [Clostridia bacterium]